MGTTKRIIWCCGLMVLSAMASPWTVFADSSQVAASSTTSANSSTSSEPTLQQGATGPAVMLLQQDLSRLGYDVGVADGIFGPKTLAAVLAFQRKEKLPVTGLVGPLTWAALQKEIQAISKTNRSTGGQGGSSSSKAPQRNGNTTSASSQTRNNTPRVSNVRKARIILQGNSVATPYVFTADDTTYMPIWYLMHVLSQVNIHSTWSHGTLALTVPNTIPIDWTRPVLGNGPQVIAVNGKAMAKVADIPYRDPYTNHYVAFMPIWYLQQVMQRLNMTYTWNGVTWTIHILPAYLVYAADGTLKGAFSSLSAAKSSLTGVPGGVVKDATGRVLYTAPSTVSYTVYGADGSIIGTYSTLSAAKSASSGMPGAQVKDSAGHVVYTVPMTVTYAVYSVFQVSPSQFPTLNAAKSAASGSPGAIVADSTGKLVYAAPIPYAAYSQDGTLIGVYNSVQDAESVLANQPGGTVEDANGAVVYQQPAWAAYEAFDPTGKLIGAYVTLLDAERALASHPGGTVKNASGSTVFTQPASVSYTAQGADGSVLGTYTSWQDAMNAIQNIPGARVFDYDGNVLAVAPIQPAYTAITPQGVLIGLYPTLQLAEQGVGAHPGAVVKNESGQVVYTQPSPGGSSTGFTNVDLRFAAPANINAKSIDTYLTAHGSPLAGLGQAFMDAQRIYGVNANYLVSHAIWETGWGKSAIALAKNNLFGYGAFDANPGEDAGRFPSNEYAILFEGWEVRQNYLTPGSSLYVSPTLTGMNVHYATDPHWAAGIAGLMGQMASYVGDTINHYTQYSVNKTAPAPKATNEPVFWMNGAQAVVTKVPNYNGLPYYASWSQGASQMFTRTLQNGDQGGDVATLQNALNQTIQAGLTVDGIFGPMTKAAVQQYQMQHGLPVTGICDATMWRQLFPATANTLPVGSKVAVDQIEQGMAGGLVVAWYHIVNRGWVNGQYVHFTNVYRLTVPDPKSAADSTVSVYDPAHPTVVLTTLHAGDFVVCNSTNPVNGMYRIQYSDLLTGKPMQGLVKATQARMTAVQ
ncbi:MAG: peptidoglycan-binding protein [Alicyclobacillus sp.]|nr:peptidoglycan-binding protein [Alicyclobacillus sp.]